MRYWGVGNESWGCGGNFTPEDTRPSSAASPRGCRVTACDLALHRLRPQQRRPRVDAPFFEHAHRERSRCAATASGASRSITTRGTSAAARTTDWNAGKGDAVEFTTDEWYELLHEADQMEALITDHWKAMGEIDRAASGQAGRGRVGRLAPRGNGGRSRRTSSASSPRMRDALLAGLTLDIFQRHADKVGMANVAQLVNCLQSLYLAHEDRFVATPTYHVFEMYGAHVGGQAVRIDLFGAARRLRSREWQGIVVGSGRLRIAQESNGDADGRQSSRDGRPRDRDSGSRRTTDERGGHHARRERPPRAQYVRRARYRPSSNRCRLPRTGRRTDVPFPPRFSDPPDDRTLATGSWVPLL